MGFAARHWPWLALALASCGAKSELQGGAPGSDAGRGPDDSGAVDAVADVRDASSFDAPALDAPVFDAPFDAPYADVEVPCSAVAQPAPLGTTPIAAGLVDCPASVYPEPCPGMCGNGVVDTCIADDEECDYGLGNQTCNGLGYASGSLYCSNCRFERSGCDDCVEGGAVSKCTVAARLGANGFGLVAKPTRVMLATTEVDRDGYARWARLESFAPDLKSSRLGTGCLPSIDVGGIAVAAVPDGWLVAVDTYGGIDLYVVDEGGTPISAVRIDEANSPYFSEWADGLILMGFERGVAQHVARVDGAGRVLSETLVFESVYAGTVYDIASTGEAFLLTKRLSPGGVHVARIERDGRVTCITAASHDDTEYPQLAWWGSRGRLTWADFSGDLDVAHAWLDRFGRDTRTTGFGRSHFNPAPVLANPSGSLVLLGSYTGGVYVSSQLTLAELDADGLSTREQIVVDNPGAVSGHVLVAIDDRRAVAGWLRHDSPWGVSEGIGLALVQR